MRKATGAILALLLVVGVLVCGCGGGDDSAQPVPGNGNGQENGSTGNAKKPVFQGLWLPDDLKELVERVAELRFIMKSGGEENVVHYRYLDEEQLDGRQSSRVEFNLLEDQITVWLDNEGNILQMKYNDETIPQELAEAYYDMSLGWVFLPFTMAQELDIQGILEEEIAGYSVSITGPENKTIGDVTGKIYWVEVKIGPPWTPQGAEATWSWSIGDFGDFQMLVGWDVAYGDPSMDIPEFTVDKLSLR